MMRLSFILLFLLPLSVLGQNDTISFVTYWSKGDVFEYQINKIAKTWRDGKLRKQEKGGYKARLEVLDSGATYYRVQWTYEMDPRQFFRLPAQVQNLAVKLGEMKVIYRVSELGELQKLENWQEVHQTWREISEMVLQAYGEKLSDAERATVKSGLDAILQAYNSSEGITSLFLKDLQVLHFAFGSAFKVGETLEYEDQLPNMMGGKPLKADAKLFISQVDTTTQQCVLRHQMHVNPEAAKTFMIQILQKMGATKEEVKKELGQAKIDVNDDNYLEYNYEFGIPIKITTHRTTQIQIGVSKNRKETKRTIVLIRD